ncbi:uncharacterized protein NPIL_37411 [Nephila pilipes]|uniref:Uncharacterized protein n=1 Tax=Nephila pilipes TaxID=299642 RepID=A0A8X6PYI8_NEPPI|nr:uncharacterized protein NPIL_37411 [Nephila pilipes]
MKCPESHFELWTVLCALLLCRADGTSLMKRIRERQNADDALRGLEMSSENWIQVPQPVQDVLMSIDDKLRGLDTFSYTLKLARLDFSLDQLVRRMENIESKLGRLDTKFDVRMEKVEEVVVSKDIKEEFSNEHLSRKLENLNEKINNKAAYLDAKLDIKLERVLNKLDLLERDLHNSVDDILERLVKGEERCMALENETVKKDEKLEEIRTQVRDMTSFTKDELVKTIDRNFDQLNAEMKDVQLTLHHKENKSEQALTNVQTTFAGANERVLTLLKDSNNKIDNLSATFSQGERARSGADLFDVGRVVTQEQLENLTAVLDKALTAHEAKFKELDSDVEMYTRKVINGIQELWKTSDELKTDLSNTLEQGSKTREMVRQEFQRLHEQIEPLPKLEPKLSDISEDLDKKVYELSTTVDNSFATLLVAQNTFIDSCRRIQQEETHIYDILQQIVYEMRNRSISDIHRISTELRSQSSEINKSLAHVLTAVLLTGNITTSAVNDLLTQLKQKDQCVILKADNIEWNVMESFCRQLSQDEQFTVVNAHKNASEHSFSEEEIRKKFDLSSSSESVSDAEALYDAEVSDQKRDMSELSEYDMDYQLSET